MKGTIPMKKLMTAAIAATLAFGVAACGEMAETEAAGISGTWKANIESASFENDNRDWLLADGTFDCRSCQPPYQVAANGEWQTVDRPGYDGQMIEIVDDNTVKGAIRKGEDELGNSTWSVSEDGQTMTITYNDLDGDEPVTGSTNFTRTAAGPDGSHAVSGQWTVSDVADISDAGLTFSYTLDGDTLTSAGNSGGYAAVLGGDPVTPADDDTGGMLAVEQVSDNVYRETYTRDGEVLNVTEITVDGDTLSFKSDDPRDGSVVTWTASRQ